MTSHTHHMLKLLASFWLGLLAPSFAATPAEKFAAARSALDAKDYAAAVENVDALINEGHFSPEAFFLMGNAEFRREKAGSAALAFRRALYLQPDYPEARQNLQFLSERDQLIDFSQQKKASLIDSLSPSLLRNGLAGGIWITALALGGLILFGRRHRSLPAITLTCAVIGILLAATSYGFAKSKDKHAAHPDSEVILESGVILRSAPASRASEVANLPAGSVVIAIEKRGKWSYVAMPGDRRGWIRSSCHETLWPFDRSFAG